MNNVFMQGPFWGPMPLIQERKMVSTNCFRVVVVKEGNVGIGLFADKVTGDTIIGEGTKIDNQVHVGHDTVIGKEA
jgi:UDP-3-O-[3-hydroxymyristoyl] glucosamine N-acyltransferase